MIWNRLNSFRYAFKGIFDVFRHTPNVKIHLIAALGVIVSGFIFQISTAEWCWCVCCIFAVLAAETFNSSIEYLTDLVSPDYHVLAGKAKDAAAGAVLLLSIGTAIIGGIIFIPKAWILIGSYF